MDDPDDYIYQFLPDDAFNLFGEYGLDFNHFLATDFEAVNTDFQVVEPQEATALGDNVPLSTWRQPNNLTNASEPTLPVLQNSSTSTQSALHNQTFKENTIAYTPGVAEPNASKDSTATAKKRKLLTAFSAVTGEDVPLHTRKPFPEQRKQDVALHRKIGVCIQCRLRKVAVCISKLF